jgi:hypothetical protein
LHAGPARGQPSPFRPAHGNGDSGTSVGNFTSDVDREGDHIPATQPLQGGDFTSVEVTVTNNSGSENISVKPVDFTITAVDGAKHNTSGLLGFARVDGGRDDPLIPEPERPAGGMLVVSVTAR